LNVYFLASPEYQSLSERDSVDGLLSVNDRSWSSQCFTNLGLARRRRLSYWTLPKANNDWAQGDLVSWGQLYLAGDRTSIDNRASLAAQVLDNKYAILHEDPAVASGYFRVAQNEVCLR
jgi:hypothetical protein